MTPEQGSAGAQRLHQCLLRHPQKRGAGPSVPPWSGVGAVRHPQMPAGESRRADYLCPGGHATRLAFGHSGGPAVLELRAVWVVRGAGPGAAEQQTVTPTAGGCGHVAGGTGSPRWARPAVGQHLAGRLSPAVGAPRTTVLAAPSAPSAAPGRVSGAGRSSRRTGQGLRHSPKCAAAPVRRGPTGR